VLTFKVHTIKDKGYMGDFLLTYIHSLWIKRESIIFETCSRRMFLLHTLKDVTVFFNQKFLVINTVVVKFLQDCAMVVYIEACI